MHPSQSAVPMRVFAGGQVLIDLLTPEPPFHPNVVLFSKFFPRCRATYTQLDIAGIVIDTAARLGLED